MLGTVQSLGSDFDFSTIFERLTSRKPNFVCITMMYSAATTTF
jgi:hypothetical protein